MCGVRNGRRFSMHFEQRSGGACVCELLSCTQCAHARTQAETEGPGGLLFILFAAHPAVVVHVQPKPLLLFVVHVQMVEHCSG
jgi:hypothetical protein